MIVKVVEIRDRMTYIPAVALKVQTFNQGSVSDEAMRQIGSLLLSVGFHKPQVEAKRLANAKAEKRYGVV